MQLGAQPLASALSSIFSELGAKALAAGTLPTQSSSAEQNVPLSWGLAFWWGHRFAAQGPAPRGPRSFPEEDLGADTCAGERWGRDRRGGGAKEGLEIPAAPLRGGKLHPSPLLPAGEGCEGAAEALAGEDAAAGRGSRPGVAAHAVWGYRACPE